MRETTHRSWKTSSLSWEQLVVSSPQLGGVFRSEPVGPGVEQGLRNRFGEKEEKGETAKGSYGATVMGKTAPFGNMRETRAGRLAHSAGNSWWSAHLSWEECSGPNQCGRVRAVMDRAGGPSVTVTSSAS
ncbi:hypothetical protein F2Q68_00020895 [Brassica cretica]|uniref:Uncharacterized protein n=1 Tax=Brassica cretica TaxID=69181 RepID=A0A8S9FXR0_BRACR|nr:hypothetical protein F2Q68_00020895 [Brassica cretica]